MEQVSEGVGCADLGRITLDLLSLFILVKLLSAGQPRPLSLHIQIPYFMLSVTLKLGFPLGIFKLFLYLMTVW